MSVSSCAPVIRRTGINGTRYASILIKEHGFATAARPKASKPTAPPPRRIKPDKPTGKKRGQIKYANKPIMSRVAGANSGGLRPELQGVVPQLYYEMCVETAFAAPKRDQNAHPYEPGKPHCVPCCNPVCNTHAIPGSCRRKPSSASFQDHGHTSDLFCAIRTGGEDSSCSVSSLEPAICL